MKDDVTISLEAEKLHVREIAKKYDIFESELEPFGKWVAKIESSVYDRLKDKPNGKLILVTAITPTPFGEGKTTMTVGLVDSLARIGKKVMGALREPSLGPVLGMKGGATGGGYAQVLPKEKINLHFTGDIHAITTTHNFLSAAIDNSIHFGNPLKLDLEKITWPRTLDMNDRAIREIETEYRKDKFIITAASEIMAILCLAKDIKDLRSRLGDILIGYDTEGNEVHARALNIIDSMIILLQDALKPNLVQTLEHNGVLIHGGPFANIAHGCNSIIATQTALKLADYVVTEAGFGADLGAEKFIDIKTRYLGETPSAVVVVATLRALKYHGMVEGLSDLEALKIGVSNLEKHTQNLKNFNLPYIIALNKFENDSKEELEWLLNWAKDNNHPISLAEVFLKGSIGGEDLANQVVKLAETKREVNRVYDLSDDLFTKVSKIATNIYGATQVVYSPKAERKLIALNEIYKDYPVCIAKTPLSFSNDPKRKGLPHVFDLAIEDVRISRGARFVVVLTKGIITMPGLPEVPNATKMFIDDLGNISGKL
ncbi:formate--tetrahydrofolate ligase [Acholeplasma vituli]|uniref:Formate--tetrahydrofolate ligase n=1 Tax=Paracholeplasma vituli TaxID=69473 RepID=A0ABT2PT03_9MOLU|nr:formate--tetrahydrofolate ligase [Paracholeplasma vituli]MCU0104079.1 formate--tetrahydrofolate ligase [Paracholeplasma vituli]